MVMLQMLPGKVRQFRSRTFTQPSFGSLMRPDDWPVRSTFNDTGSGKRKLPPAPFLRGRGARPWPAHQLR